MAESSGLPAWIYKRDGRLVPFEPDKITQSLFSAGEAMGQGDAFLAQELTDGVLHFLARDFGSETPTTAQVADLIVKVVRELGQPALANAFSTKVERHSESPGELAREVVFRFSALDTPTGVIEKCLREYSLNAVFGRDIVSAHRDGLLRLTGLESPLELASCVIDIGAGAPGELLRNLQEVRQRVAGAVALDGPEYASAGFLAPADRARLFGAELQSGLQATGLEAIVNLHCAMPPAWAKRGGEGPLFSEQSQANEGVGDFLDEFLQHSLSAAAKLGINWHLGTSDFEGPPDPRLLRLLRKALESGRIAFAFDRPRRAVALGEGLDRRNSAVLLGVGVNLLRLLDWPGVGADLERFLNKLTSLARMSISAGLQKRAFLRRQTERKDLLRGFFLERSRLMVIPIGLEAAAQRLSSEGKQETARQIAQHLVTALRQHGQAGGLDTCVDGPVDPGHLTGVTACDAAAPLQTQLRAAGLLHNAADRGTAALLIPEDQLPSPEQARELLQFAWQRTDVSMLRFVAVRPEQRVLKLTDH